MTPRNRSIEAVRAWRADEAYGKLDGYEVEGVE